MQPHVLDKLKQRDSRYEQLLTLIADAAVMALDPRARSRS